MQKIKKWWGWVIQDNNENTLGFLDRENFKGWGVVAADNKTFLGEFNTRQEAIDFLLNQEDETPDIFNRWITTNEILEHMTESEFKIQVFEHHIRIVDTNLGQPRHPKIMGAGLFFLENAHG